jgi:hypothetical protein
VVNQPRHATIITEIHQQIEDIAINLALGVVRDNMFKHGYDGARIPVDELFRTLDDFLAEFHAKNNKREKPQP